MRNFVKKMILFLTRKRLGLKKYEGFAFVGQKSDTYYYFSDDMIVKVFRQPSLNAGKQEPSHVALNWLLDDSCEIVRVCE